MLKLKEGIQLTVSKRVLEIIDGVESVFRGFDVPCVITSGTDGKHGEKSKHYTAEALDFRVSNLKPEHLQSLVKLCKERLGKDFDIVLEQDHLHVEYDPKGI